MNTVDEVFGNMARSMTNAIRTYGVTNYSGVPDAGPARGTMWFTSTCVHVRWSWIAFPAAMIGMYDIFLVLVHIESRGTETERLWKSSVLALLFCEMNSEVVDKAHPIHKSTLNEVAKSKSAKDFFIDFVTKNAKDFFREAIDLVHETWTNSADAGAQDILDALTSWETQMGEMATDTSLWF
ncbi:unnamed protein product [Alternaria alternata]